MAILKHLASKSANYSNVVRYLMFEHDRLSGRPLIEDGHLVMRQDFFIDGLECDPATFEIECRELNDTWHKNQSYDEIKSHHYILSFDPRDATYSGLTGEHAQSIGMDYAKKNFPGHQAIICTHLDGENHSGNIHVHIVINSLRKNDVERQDYMERNCDSRAGYKRHPGQRGCPHPYSCHRRAGKGKTTNRPKPVESRKNASWILTNRKIHSILIVRIESAKEEVWKKIQRVFCLPPQSPPKNPWRQ